MDGARVDVRPATPADAADIRRVGHETWPSTYAFAGEEYVAHGLATWWSDEAVVRGIETTRTFVAEVADVVVGMGNLDLRPERPVIWKLYVVPAWHGHGAGHALMARLLEEAPAGAEVVLEYLDGNSSAARFYVRHGFTELRREPSEVPGWPAQVWLVHSPAA